MKYISIDDLDFKTVSDSERAVILSSQDLGLNARLTVACINPGTKLKPHVHKVRVEVVEIMSGTGQVIVNGEAVASRPGEFVLVQPGDVHSLVNLGKDKFVTAFYTFNDPGEHDMIWVEEEVRQ